MIAESFLSIGKETVSQCTGVPCRINPGRNALRHAGIRLTEPERQR